MDEERGAVERSRTTLPNPAWVRIKHGKHKSSIGRVFKSGQETIEVLFPTCDFPYPMPQGCRSLVERSRLPQDNSVSDIILDDQVVGWKFKGESYYMGLLLKNFHRDHLELLATPHADDIQLHLESGWDKPFLKKTVVAFSMQFLRAGDHARVIKGALCGELGKVISTDHTCGSVGLEFTFDECPEEIEVRLQDIERVFRLGDTVRVVAGPYLGLEGHVLKMCEDVFHVCQAVSKEVVSLPAAINLKHTLTLSTQVEISKYYLDRRPLSHTLNSQLPVQQYFEPPPDSGSIEIGDFIQVLDGEHAGKRGIVDWLSKADTKLWFRDFFTPVDTESGLSSISVPIAMVQRTDLTQTIQYTRERGYDVKPGDVVNVARGPDYGAKGVVQSVDFPNARLTLLCDGDRSLVSTTHLNSGISDLW
jgi:ribosomal protein L24